MLFEKGIRLSWSIFFNYGKNQRTHNPVIDLQDYAALDALMPWSKNVPTKINKQADCTTEIRHKERLVHSQPVLDEFLAWLKIEKARVAPKTKLGEALTYCLNQWSKLTVFLEDGCLELDNNRAERSIKPFVMGRNYVLKLFMCSKID